MALECGKTIEVINEVDLDWLDLRNFEKEDEVVVVDFETLLEDYDRIKKSLPESPQKIRKYEANKVKPIVTDTAKEITTITLDDEDVVDKQDEYICHTSSQNFSGGGGPGGPRTKMKKSSENFWRAKNGVPKFFACVELFFLWRHCKPLKTVKFLKN